MMTSKFHERATKYFEESVQSKQRTAEKCVDSIVKVSRAIATCFRNGNKLLLCGNGGSAADCQHVATELVCRLTKEITRPGLPAIALTTDTSFLTAYCNDFNVEGIFARQVQALGKAGDILLGISTSGSSPNVLKAIEEAKSKKILTIAFCGDSGTIAQLSDMAVAVPSKNTGFIQESHLALYHVMCDLIEQELFGALKDAS